MSTPKNTPSPAEVDELGQLQAWLAPRKAEIKPAEEREKALRDKMAAAFDDRPPGEVIQLHGLQYVAVIHARGWERKITNMKKLFKALGAVLFFKVCDVGLGKLDALTTEAQRKEFVVKQQTGARKVEAVNKVEMAA